MSYSIWSRGWGPRESKHGFSTPDKKLLQESQPIILGWTQMKRINICQPHSLEREWNLFRMDSLIQLPSLSLSVATGIETKVSNSLIMQSMQELILASPNKGATCSSVLFVWTPLQFSLNLKFSFCSSLLLLSILPTCSSPSQTPTSKNHLEMLPKCWFWLRSSRTGPEIQRFQQAPGEAAAGSWNILSSKGLDMSFSNSAVLSNHLGSSIKH